ncbi:MAG: hypothetical protein WC370_02925 [Dehalococcoidales bacterium]|jgi:hypothetical protein
MTYEKIDTADIKHSIAKYNSSLSILIVVTIAIAIASIYFGITIATTFTWGLLALIPLLVTFLYFSSQRRKLKSLLEIRNDWGKPIMTKERDFKAIRPLFDDISSDDKSNYIDEQTWKDLNMDQLYAKIDRTYTDPGEAVLYRILREPLFDKEELAERSRVIRFFQNSREARERIQLVFIRLGHQFVHNDLFTLLWRDKFPKSRIKPFFTILALAALVSLIIPFVFWSAFLVPIPVAVFIINLLIHYYTKRRKDLETISFPYLISCIKTARKLSSVTYGEIKPYTKRLEELYKTSRGILKKARFLFPTDPSFTDPATGFLLEYLNIFFLLEVRAFYATTDELARHISELRELYLTLGKLDAMQSVASYRTSLSTYAEPEFIEEGIHLEVREAKQPLLENPVPASITFGKNVVIITGSNMGGKSTFLRNIGNNALMAQTIATTVTSYYRGSFFRIISSISRTDDLIAGKSFYYVEAERILKTIQSFGKKIPTLCIIDELLSGTNSTERLHASEVIIRYLATQNTLAMIATHDLELADRLNGACDFYHFTDNVDETGLKFDYLLKPGIATTRNAVALLKYLGYPKEITEKASEKYE